MEMPDRIRPGGGEMFDSIAPRYDFLNHVLSLGADRHWRFLAASALLFPREGQPRRILDVATGTGDLAFAVLSRDLRCRVVGVDPSPKMLAIARQKAAQRALTSRLELCSGDAETLPFSDHSFDGAGIAFGIRNVPDRLRALGQMARVCKRGGRIVVLELAEPRAGLLGAAARFYIRHVLPHLAAMLSHSSPYRYLQTSMAAFPPADEFAALMTQAGIDVLAVKRLMFGAAVLFVGEAR